MTDHTELRRKADHYRKMASGFTDPQTVEALLDLAAEYDSWAEHLEKRDGSSDAPGHERPTC